MLCERCVTFEVEGQQLYGMLHLPAAEGPHPAVALLHGFSGNAAEDHFIFTKMARQLAADGLAALRFDFRGSGWSQGSFADMTIQGEVVDAIAALDYLAQQPEIDPARLGLLGMSLGGCVAALVAGRDPRVRVLTLWAAVAHPELLFGRMLLAALGAPTNGQSEADESARLTVDAMLSRAGVRDLSAVTPLDVGGLDVGAAFFGGLADARPLDALRNYRGPALVVHGTADATVPVSEAQAYVDVLQPGARQLLVVDGAGHTFGRRDHEAQVIQTSSAWLMAML